MARGTPNRGRGNGSGGYQSRGRGAGAARGRGRGGRGRGGGPATSDFTGVGLDYADLNEELADFNLSPSFIATPKTAQRPPFAQTTPSAASQYPPTPSGQESPSGSGYITPKRGLGARGGPAQRGDRGSRGRGAGLLNTVFGAGRGGRGGAGGLGFHANATGDSSSGRGRGRGGAVVGMGQGAFRPLLVPVTFVKASGLTPAMAGDSEDDDEGPADKAAEEEVAGDLEDKAMEGTLVDEVREIEAEYQDGDDDSDSPNGVMEVEQSEPAAAVTVPRGFVLGLTNNTEPLQEPSSSSDESSDNEQIVFKPQPTSSRAPPSAPAAIIPPAADTTSKIHSVSPTSPGAAPAPGPSEKSAPKSTSTLPKPKFAPPVKLTKKQKAALKKAGKKARRAGKQHARSGNMHRLAEAAAGDFSDEDDDDEVAAEAAEDDRLGREMFEKMKQVDLDEGEASDGEAKGKPRVGDSDLEWGSGGPEEDAADDDNGMTVESGLATSRTAKRRREARKAQREEKREEERMARLSQNARIQVEETIRVEDGSVAIEEEVSIKEKIVLAEDASESDDEDDENAAVDWKAAQSFADGLLGSKSGRQNTLGDMDQDDSEEGEGWQTTSGTDDSDSGHDDDAEEDEEALDTDEQAAKDYTLGEADAAVDAAMAEEQDLMYAETLHHGGLSSEMSSSDEDDAIEQALLAGKTIRLQSMGQTGPGGRRDRKERKRAMKGKGKAVQWTSSDDDSDDEDGDVDMFVGGNTWADNDEDYIRGVQAIMAAKADLIQGRGKNRDRAARNKLFKAVQQGNFEDIDLAEEYEDDIMLTAGPSRKSKNKAKPNFDGAFSADLEAQWNQDRSKKSAYKRERAEARAAAAELAGGAHQKKGKKGKRVSAAAWDSDDSVNDASLMNTKIREFLLYDISNTTMALPPMGKKARVAVHLLSEVYGLKSKSIGKGKARFPILERTKRSSTFNVDERKIRAIIGTAHGEQQQSGWAGWNSSSRGKMGGLMKELNGGKFFGGGGRGGAGGKRHNEGAVVGQGADRLGEDNIGFALLKKMGWTEGSQIGVSGGLSEPVTARIKTNKGGLGSGYSVSRSEAPRMGRAPSPPWH